MRCNPGLLVALAIDPFLSFGVAGTDLDAHSVWKDFRKAYPYSYQGIAVHERASGDYIVVIAEPPPHVSPEEIRALLPGTTLQRHAVGADGWVTDAVADFRRSESDLAALIQDLHRLMYGTTYKAHVIRLPATPLLELPRPELDFQFYPGEIRRWLRGRESEAPLSFTMRTVGSSVAVADIQLAYSDVGISQPAGLVGWWIPREMDAGSCISPIRQFAIDSDLIVGAIVNDHGMLLLGRARRVPVELLPPLRPETVVLLSRINKNQVGQTINPQQLSCFISDEERWELNLLSSELHDTEYGLLLSVADVLLKSWSLNGLNSVRGFRSYPTPQTWPFPKPLVEVLDANGLVFNYDSDAAGYVEVDSPGLRIYGVARTGVLPLAYFPANQGVVDEVSPKTVAAEQTGYAWFAAQQDPHLVRVLQYTAVMQAFQALRPTGSAKTAEFEFGETVGCQEQLISKSLRDLLELDDNALEKLKARIQASPQWARNEQDDNYLDLAFIQMSSRDETELQVWAKRLCDPALLLPAEHSQLEALDADEAENWVNWVVGPRVFGLHFCTPVLQALASADRLELKLSDALSARSKGWMHTPVLIYDRNRGALRLFTGGHNIKPAERIISSVDIPRGTVERGANGTWRVHVNDVPRLTMRGRGRPPTLGAVDPEPVPMLVKLGVKGASPPLRLYWPEPVAATLTVAESSMVTRVHGKRPGAIVALRREDGSYVIHNGNRAIVGRSHRESIDAVFDMAGGRPEFDVEVVGVTKAEAGAMGHALLARRSAPGRSAHVRVARSEPNSALPDTLDLSAVNKESVRVGSFRVQAGLTETDIIIPIGESSGRLGLWIRVKSGIANASYWTAEKILSMVRRALDGARDVLDFRKRFQRILREDLEKTFPGHDFSDIDLKMHIPLRMEDQYFSQRPNGARYAGAA